MARARARSSFVPGRCKARSCCSSPASVRRRYCAGSASRWCTSLAASGENLQDHLQARVIFQCTPADHAPTTIS